MMMTGLLLAWIQKKMTVQHFTLEVENLFNKPKTFAPVFRCLLVMLTTKNEGIMDYVASFQISDN